MRKINEILKISYNSYGIFSSSKEIFVGVPSLRFLCLKNFKIYFLFPELSRNRPSKMISAFINNSLFSYKQIALQNYIIDLIQIH